MLDIKPSSDAQFANIFSHSVGCLFTVDSFFCYAELLSLIRSHLSIFAFVAMILCVFVMKFLPIPISRMILSSLSSKVFIVLCFKALIPLEMIFFLLCSSLHY